MRPKHLHHLELKTVLTAKVLIYLYLFSFWSSETLIYFAAHHKNRKEFPELQLIIVVLPGKTPVYAEVTFLLSLRTSLCFCVSIFSRMNIVSELYVGISVEDPDPHL
jgi:hypothetical protein